MIMTPALTTRTCTTKVITARTARLRIARVIAAMRTQATKVITVRTLIVKMIAVRTLITRMICCDKNASNKGDNCEDTEDSQSDGHNDGVNVEGDEIGDHVNIEGDEIGDRRPPHIAIEVVDFSTPRGKRHRSRNSSVGSRHSKATKRSASSAAPSERGPAISQSPSPIPLQGASRVSGGAFSW